MMLFWIMLVVMLGIVVSAVLMALGRHRLLVAMIGTVLLTLFIVGMSGFKVPTLQLASLMMALIVGAVVFTNINREVPGATYYTAVEISFSGATDYVTNGIAVTAALLKMQRIDFFLPVALGPSLAAGIFGFSWDKANGKIKLYDDTGTECANALDISSVKIYALVKGI